MNSPATIEPAPERELHSSRVFNYPRTLLFGAWTNPALLAQWWGPNGFTNTFECCEMKTGGLWRFIMHGPDGTNYKNENHFIEVIEPERILMRHISWPVFEMTATFEDLGHQSKLSWTMAFESEKDFIKVKPICVEANEQNFDRLDAVLSKLG